MMAVEPLAGKCIVEVRRRRTKKDYAHFMRRVEKEIVRIARLSANRNSCLHFLGLAMAYPR